MATDQGSRPTLGVALADGMESLGRATIGAVKEFGYGAALFLESEPDKPYPSLYLLDFAAPVDVSTIKPRRLDEVKPGGLGTHFIQQCVDECGFLAPPDGAGNCLRLAKKMR